MGAGLSPDERRRQSYMEKHWPSLAKDQPAALPDVAAPKMRDGLVEPPWDGSNRREYCDHWWHGQFWHVRKDWRGGTYWEYDATSGFAATFIAAWFGLVAVFVILACLAGWAWS